jgi:putative Holliday junction resolvase
MRIMALDVGERRIGIALSDKLNLTAQPFKVIERDNKEIQELKKIIEEKGIKKIVFGIPLNSRGGETEQSKKIREFAKKLNKEIPICIDFYDERFSTSEIEKILISARITRKKRKNLRDILSAVIILQSYLDRRKI